MIDDMFENYPNANYRNATMKFIQYPEQWDLAKACRNIKNKTLILDPDFQREYVWDIAKASLLIESFLLDIPVPHIFLHWSSETERTVIDGKQRLISIYRFIEEQKWESDVFKLVLKDKDPETGKEISKKWDGKTFESLTEVEQDKLRNATLNIINFREGDNDMIFSIFERLNTGGVQLNDIQIIQSMYPYIGKTIKDISQSTEFKEFVEKFLHYDIDDKKEWKDLDFILTIISMSHNYNEYKAPLKKFKTSFCQKNKTNKDLLNELSNKFRCAIQNREFIDYLDRIPDDYKISKRIKIDKKKKAVQEIKPPILNTVLSLFVLGKINTLPDYSVFNAQCFTEKQGTAATKTIKDRFEKVLEYVKTSQQ